MGDSPRPWEIRTRDPLSQVTRAERRTLLGVSALAILMVQSGLIPTRISALGVEFGQADQRALLSMLSLIVVYFLVAFVIYAASDLVAWRVAYHQALRERRIELARMEVTDKFREASVNARVADGQAWSRASKPIVVIRAIFEFGFPLAVGIYTVIALLRAPLPPVQPSFPSNLQRAPTTTAESKQSPAPTPSQPPPQEK